MDWLQPANCCIRLSEPSCESRTGSLSADFLIIGGGIAGLSTAQGLLQQGASVTILERGITGQEASWAGGGILSPLFPWDYSDEVTRLTSRGASLFPAWTREMHERTGIDPEYDVCGMLALPPFDAQAALQWCGKRQYSSLKRADTVSHGLHGQEGAIFLDDVAQVRNPRLLRALRAHVAALGARIVERCAVNEIETAKENVISLSTSGGKVSAHAYIVTAGAWSKEILGRLALRLEIKPVRGQMLLFKFDRMPLGHIVVQEDLYLIPRRDGHVLVGSTLEDVGFDRSITMEVRAMLWKRAQKVLPSLKGRQPVQHWAGLRPASPRNIPTIGRHPELNNLYLNSGHFRYGVTMAPAAAEILCNELFGLPQPFDTTPYRSGWGV